MANKRMFQVVEDSSGGEIGEPFEADDMEDALYRLLEQQGQRVKEVTPEDDTVDITIDVRGGLIETVEIPTHLQEAGVRVVVRDYDLDGYIDEDRLEKDEDGEDCVISEYGGD